MSTREAPAADASSRKRGFAVIALLALVAFAAILVVIILRPAPGDGELNAETYAEAVAAALENSDSEIGADLVYALECNLCHLQGDGSQSPLFYGLADIASQRRPPLSAEQYLYEATLYPDAHLVEGYTNAMPNNYIDRLSEQEVGHIIAYLLSFTDGA